jgi:cytochrome c
MWTALRGGHLPKKARMLARQFGETDAPALRSKLFARRTLLALACAGLSLAGCDGQSEKGPLNFAGDPGRGKGLINQYGCGGCHLIPKIADATGNVGPPLIHVGTRTYIAGFIRNSPENMSLWIQDPQKALPGNAMPRMGVTPQDSRDITAFLYTLK